MCDGSRDIVFNTSVKIVDGELNFYLSLFILFYFSFLFLE